MIHVSCLSNNLLFFDIIIELGIIWKMLEKGHVCIIDEDDNTI